MQIYKLLQNRNIFVLLVVALGMTAVFLYDLNNPETITEQNIDVFANVQLISRNAIVYDMTADKVLYSKNRFAPEPLASLSKIMTATIAAEYLDESEVLQVDISVEDTLGGSTLVKGEKWTLKDLVQFMMFVSSNNAAESISKYANQKGLNFLSLMNQHVKFLDLFGMKFENVTGLDISPNLNGGYGSVDNMAKLISYSYRNFPWIFEPTKDREREFVSIDNIKHKVMNTNSAIEEIPDIIGSKTGYTVLAGGNLAAILLIKNHSIIIVLLGSNQIDRYQDLKLLIDLTRKSLN